MLKRTLVAAGVLACSSAFAQAPSAMDLSRHAEINQVALSPDGKYVAMTVPTADEKETQLQIVSLDGSGKTQTLRFGRLEHVSDIVWTADDRITVARARTRPLRPLPVSLGQLFSTNLDGSDQETLFGYFRDSGSTTGRRKDQGFASVAQVIDKEPGMALVQFTCWDCGETPDTVVYKVDTRTGHRDEVERVKGTASIFFDQDGKSRARVLYNIDSEPTKIEWRKTVDGPWTEMPRALAGREIERAFFSKDGKTMYAVLTNGGEATSFYKIDMANETREELPSRAGFDVSGILRAGRGGEPFGSMTDAGKPTIKYFDPTSEYAKLHAGMLKAFPGQLVEILSFTRDNKKVLIYAHSDRNPGAWYVVNRDDNSLQLVAEAMPWIKPQQLAPMMPVEFKSRHGETLHAFVTRQGGGAQPMIVLPHGGPHGPYDRWGFDPDAQFFATRGYTVIQVNYRGSGGQGKKFEESGYREWGGKMQDDLADAVKFAVDNKWADAKRVCTFGASYGGYAALMQPIRFPELYRCAIGYVGVYDLTVMNKAGDIPDTESGRRYLKRVLGDDKAVWIANSPARNVDKIKVPVFLAQGAVDNRVPMDQFNAMKNAMSANGVKVETMVAAGEGHGFFDPKNREALYLKVEDFLKRNDAP